MGLRLGIDTGGTFTDFVLVDDAVGVIATAKRLSDATDPAAAVIEGTAAILESNGIAHRELTDVVVGTTLASNLILERKGHGAALITTRGFRDVLSIGRQKRYDIYDLSIDKPRPVIRRRHIYEVTERTLADGTVVTSPTTAELEQVARRLRELRTASVAVCLLHSYVNPKNEQIVGSVLQRLLPDLQISLSSEISPQWREYERTVTTTLNAYVRPTVLDYLSRVVKAFTDAGYQGTVLVMQSNGGMGSYQEVGQAPVRLIESGPAAGAIVASKIAVMSGFQNVLALDMGGTTAKVCLIRKGSVPITDSHEIDMVGLKRSSGLPLILPAVDLIEIGTGGGSIARVSQLGVVVVGPESAGAFPGPACYQRGGTRPTVTDADLVLGYIDAQAFGDAAMTVGPNAARSAIQREVGDLLELSEVEAAWAIHQIANRSMAAAARAASLERGVDPRSLVLIASGGAGPVHAARVARELQIDAVAIPVGAGVASAAGLLAADVKFNLSRTFFASLDNPDWSGITALIQDLRTQARGLVDRAAPARAAESVELISADMRYRGQGYEIGVTLPSGRLGPGAEPEIRDAFEREYAGIYGAADRDGVPETTSWHLELSLPGNDKFLNMATKPDSRPVPLTRPAYFPEAGGLIDCPVYSRYTLNTFEHVSGPALVEEPGSTIVVLPGQRFHVEEHGVLIIAEAKHE